MKVLKFGGSSVATSENIKKVLAIVGRASKNQKIAVVVSAFGKTTNNLLAGADESLNDINSAKETLKNLKELHFNVIDDLVFKNKKDVSKEVSYLFDRLSSIYEGIFLLKNYLIKQLQKYQVLVKDSLHI
jgi:aspartokinase/homoserine dehydrogenase 1